MRLWQKILIGIAALAVLVYNRGNSLLWIGALIGAGALAYDRFRPDRRSHVEKSRSRAARKEARGPKKRLVVKTSRAIAALLAVLMTAAVLWALPYIIAAATLGALCPWTPPGITDPYWSCSGSTPAEPHPEAQASSALRAFERLAFAIPSGKGSTSDIFVMYADGTGLTNLTRSEGADDRTPAWSPDGTEIAFSSDGGGPHARDVDVIDVGSRRLRNLTNGRGANYDPAWSPDGRKIAFAAERWDEDAGRYDGHYEIYVRHRGAAVEKLTRNDADDVGPAWSPAGPTIAFATKRDGNWEIYAMSADGSAQRNLSHDAADDEDPAWSPAGRKIAFVSDRTGTGEVYVMNGDGSNVRRLTRSPGDKENPVWSPDAREIAFIDRSDRGIYVMNADGTRVRRLLEGVDSAGGLSWQRIAARRAAPAGAAHLCTKDGIRYAGATAQGAAVCFTLTRDGTALVETGFSFVPASGCPNGAVGTVQSDFSGTVDPSGRIRNPDGFTATIHGARAAGVLEDSTICGSKKFRWSARRAP